MRRLMGIDRNTLLLFRGGAEQPLEIFEDVWALEGEGDDLIVKLRRPEHNL